jgi:hypothetical protein
MVASAVEQNEPDGQSLADPSDVQAVQAFETQTKAFPSAPSLHSVPSTVHAVALHLSDDP